MTIHVICGVYSNGWGLETQRISVTLLGCFLASIRLYGKGCCRCVARLNSDTETFNRKQNVTVEAGTGKAPHQPQDHHFQHPHATLRPL
ncbi:hypothetical protein GUJ93_ZPchr0006g42289 [Zizania palustris]|uniref:Uncharacterized protein n=1 Tax=Zizania palustris TaxID=103762 RepID=A0A8J5VJ32_ZIZPA|nr:hypothetical protein GUJ93_ZPchr0006g42289 [Zizania palustris]